MGKRIERLATISRHLLSGGVSDIGELARMFGCSRRTVYRDIDVLKDCGMAIEYDATRECYRVDIEAMLQPISSVDQATDNGGRHDGELIQIVALALIQRQELSIRIRVPGLEGMSDQTLQVLPTQISQEAEGSFIDALTGNGEIIRIPMAIIERVQVAETMAESCLVGP